MMRAVPGTIIYQCNRNGQKRQARQRATASASAASSSAVRLRGASARGTRRGRCCLARITVSGAVGVSDVVVRHVETHTDDHEQGLDNLRFMDLSEAKREEVKRLLLLGIPADQIVLKNHSPLTSLEARSEAPDGNLIFTRDQLLSRKDVHNILRSLERDGRLVLDDAGAVHVEVTRLQSRSNNPVLLYKRQGNVDIHTRDGVELSKAADLAVAGRFALVIQTHEQRRAWRQYSPVSLVDATHGVTQYGFKLTTLLVIDEERRGVPVAWLISDKEDGVAFRSFLEVVRAASPDTVPKVVLSDDDSACFASVKDVFPDVRHLLCHWHLQRTWQRALNVHMRDEDRVFLMQQSLKALRLLRDMPTRREFNAARASVQRDLEQASPDFWAYFQKNYLQSEDRIKQWAAFARQMARAGADTSNAIESFHNVFKMHYLKGRVNKRVADLIGHLFTYESQMVHRMAINRYLARKSPRSSQEEANEAKARTIPHGDIADMGRCTLATVNQWLGVAHSDDGIGAGGAGDDSRPGAGGANGDAGTGFNHDEPMQRFTVKSQSPPEKYYVVSLVGQCHRGCAPGSECVHQFACTCPFWTAGHETCKHTWVVFLKGTPGFSSRAARDAMKDEEDGGAPSQRTFVPCVQLAAQLRRLTLMQKTETTLLQCQEEVSVFSQLDNLTDDMARDLSALVADFSSRVRALGVYHQQAAVPSQLHSTQSAEQQARDARLIAPGQRNAPRQGQGFFPTTQASARRRQPNASTAYQPGEQAAIRAALLSSSEDASFLSIRSASPATPASASTLALADGSARGGRGQLLVGPPSLLEGVGKPGLATHCAACGVAFPPACGTDTACVPCGKALCNTIMGRARANPCTQQDRPRPGQPASVDDDEHMDHSCGRGTCFVAPASVGVSALPALTGPSPSASVPVASAPHSLRGVRARAATPAHVRPLTTALRAPVGPRVPSAPAAPRLLRASTTTAPLPLPPASVSVPMHTSCLSFPPAPSPFGTPSTPTTMPPSVTVAPPLAFAAPVGALASPGLSLTTSAAASRGPPSLATSPGAAAVSPSGSGMAVPVVPAGLAVAALLAPVRGSLQNPSKRVCFVNSELQALLHLLGVRTLLLRLPALDPVVAELQRIEEALAARQATDVYDLLDLLAERSARFQKFLEGYHDCTEFWTNLLDLLHSLPDSAPRVESVFYSTLHHTRECVSDSSQPLRAITETFNYVMLRGAHASAQEALSKSWFQLGHEMDISEGGTEHRYRNVRCRMTRVPPVLVVGNPYDMHPNGAVHHPAGLHPFLDSFVVEELGPTVQAVCQGQQCQAHHQYVIQSIVLFQSAHYVAGIRRPDGRWELHNDARVAPVFATLADMKQANACWVERMAAYLRVHVAPGSVPALELGVPMPLFQRPALRSGRPRTPFNPALHKRSHTTATYVVTLVFVGSG